MTRILTLIRRAFDAWEWRRARRQVLREYPSLRTHENRPPR